MNKNKNAALVTNDIRKFLSLRDAACEIGATRRFLERRIEDGELAVFRPSRRLVRVSRAELDRWIASYSHGGHRANALNERTGQ
jgi:excisionase family DNA binding protein